MFHVYKHGSLSVRPYEDDGDAVEYLTMPLIYDVNYVHIYRRAITGKVDVFDLRAA